MYQEFQDAILRSWLFSATYPFLLLCVRRSPYLVHDTLQQVEGASSAGNLKKPLKACSAPEAPHRPSQGPL